MARLKEFASDSMILKEDTICTKMFIVVEGKVILYKNYGTEDEYVIGVCSKSKTFGEMNLFTNEPSFYTAVAFTDVKLACFEKENLSQFIKEYPDSTMNLLENIAKSYMLISKNLQMAIDEINALRQEQIRYMENTDITEHFEFKHSELEPLSYDDIISGLHSSICNEGQFHSNDINTLREKRPVSV